MKRAYEYLNDPELVALVHLEQAESILSDLDEMTDYRKRVTDIRSDLGSELMQQSFSDLVEEPDRENKVYRCDECGSGSIRVTEDETQVVACFDCDTVSEGQSDQ